MQSLDEIYQAHANSVFKYLMVLTKNRDIAEELTQETFYQAVRCIHQYDGSCKISTWLCAIAKNQYFNYIKKRKREVTTLSDVASISASSEDMYVESTERISLLKKLHSCKEPYREVMYLRIFGNLSFKEIGDIMGQSENWARVTFYRGKMLVKLKMEVSDNEI